AREVRRVAEIWGAGSVVATGSEASEAMLAQRAPGAEVLHIAAHGRIDRITPWRSRLDLAAGGGADGRLTAEEIAASGLGAARVVLSGCETAAESAVARDEAPGDEREGLVRAFLRAGA